MKLPQGPFFLELFSTPFFTTCGKKIQRWKYAGKLFEKGVLRGSVSFHKRPLDGSMFFCAVHGKHGFFAENVDNSGVLVYNLNVLAMANKRKQLTD